MNHHNHVVSAQRWSDAMRLRKWGSNRATRHLTPGESTDPNRRVLEHKFTTPACFEGYANMAFAKIRWGSISFRHETSEGNAFFFALLLIRLGKHSAVVIVISRSTEKAHMPSLAQWGNTPSGESTDLN